jgi:hypothetical protein
MFDKTVNISIIALSFVLVVGVFSMVVSSMPDDNVGTRFEMLYPATTLDKVDVTVRLIGFKSGENPDKVLADFQERVQMRISWFAHADIPKKVKTLMPELFMMAEADGVKIDSIYIFKENE